jgi:hypothetical protein
MSGGRRQKLRYAVADDGRFAFNGSQGVREELSAGKADRRQGFGGGSASPMSSRCMQLQPRVQGYCRGYG